MKQKEKKKEGFFKRFFAKSDIAVFREKANNFLKEKDAKIKNQNAQIQALEKDIGKYSIKDRPKWNSTRKEKKRFSFFMRRSLKRKPEISYFIGMTFPNGTYREYIVVGNRPSFNIMGRTFLIDTKEALFDLNQNQYRLQYHFNETMPVKKEVRPYVDEGNEVWLSVKSDNAKPIFRQEYVRNVASANEISKYFIVNLVISGLNFFMTLLLAMFVFLMSRAITHLVKAIAGV